MNGLLRSFSCTFFFLLLSKSITKPLKKIPNTIVDSDPTPGNHMYDVVNIRIKTESSLSFQWLLSGKSRYSLSGKSLQNCSFTPSLHVQPANVKFNRWLGNVFWIPAIILPRPMKPEKRIEANIPNSIPCIKITVKLKLTMSMEYRIHIPCC